MRVAFFVRHPVRVLHQNTVRYRLDRVKALLGHEDWLSIELAVRIYQLHGRL